MSPQMVPIHEMGDVPPTPIQSQLSMKEPSDLRGAIGSAVTAGINRVNRSARAHRVSDAVNIFLMFFLTSLLSSLSFQLFIASKEASTIPRAHETYLWKNR
jgi:hypothetical protein